MIKNLLLVGVGGFIGSVLRFGSYHLIKTNQTFITTLIINIVGSLLIGFIIGYSIKDENFSSNWKPFLASGICGGFTTFSAFSFENIQMIHEGKYLLLIIYILTSVLLGIAAAFIGFKMAG